MDTVKPWDDFKSLNIKDALKIDGVLYSLSDGNSINDIRLVKLTNVKTKEVSFHYMWKGHRNIFIKFNEKNIDISKRVKK